MFSNEDVSVGKAEYIKEKEVNESKSYFKEEFGVNITNACIVNVALKSGDQKANLKVTVIEIDGKWYIYKLQ